MENARHPANPSVVSLSAQLMLVASPSYWTPPLLLASGRVLLDQKFRAHKCKCPPLSSSTVNLFHFSAFMNPATLLAAIGQSQVLSDPQRINGSSSSSSAKPW
jgi:hypothetical protein